MTGTLDTPDDAVRTVLQDILQTARPINTAIHPDDQMLSFVYSSRGSEGVARSEYFTSGVQLLKVVEQLVRWKFGTFDAVGAFLDFASGYGRLTRFLVPALPADRLWVSDIQADAVTFQQTEFGVHGFVSTVDPADLACDERFDCIFVASLFSHLPEATFGPWLKKLAGLLKPGGLLAFSVHHEAHLEAGETMPESGIKFTRASEIAALDTRDYGVAVVTEDFVRRAILAATGRPAYQRIRHGLLYHQDLYLVVNDPTPDFSGLHFAYLPHGTVEFGLWRDPTTLYLRGWAADTGGAETPLAVQVFVDGRLAQTCAPTVARPDLQAHFRDVRFLQTGWECRCPVPEGDAARMLRVQVVSKDEAESPLYLGPIDALLPHGLVEYGRPHGEQQLYLCGWAVDPAAPEAPVTVQVVLEGRLRQQCLATTPRPDLAAHFGDARFRYGGWACLCPLYTDEPAGVLEVHAVSSHGADWLLYRGSIDFLVHRAPPEATPPPPADPADATAQMQVLRTEGERRLAYIRHLEAEIARKNAALATLEKQVRHQARGHLRSRLSRVARLLRRA